MSLYLIWRLNKYNSIICVVSFCTNIYKKHDQWSGAWASDLTSKSRLLDVIQWSVIRSWCGGCKAVSRCRKIVGKVSVWRSFWSLAHYGSTQEHSGRACSVWSRFAITSRRRRTFGQEQGDAIPPGSALVFPVGLVSFFSSLFIRWLCWPVQIAKLFVVVFSVFQCL